MSNQRPLSSRGRGRGSRRNVDRDSPSSFGWETSEEHHLKRDVKDDHQPSKPQSTRVRKQRREVQLYVPKGRRLQDETEQRQLKNVDDSQETDDTVGGSSATHRKRGHEQVRDDYQGKGEGTAGVKTIHNTCIEKEQNKSFKNELTENHPQLRRPGGVVNAEGRKRIGRGLSLHRVKNEVYVPPNRRSKEHQYSSDSVEENRIQSDHQRKDRDMYSQEYIEFHQSDRTDASEMSAANSRVYGTKVCSVRPDNSVLDERVHKRDHFEDSSSMKSSPETSLEFSTMPSVQSDIPEASRQCQEDSGPTVISISEECASKVFHHDSDKGTKTSSSDEIVSSDVEYSELNTESNSPPAHKMEEREGDRLEGVSIARNSDVDSQSTDTGSEDHPSKNIPVSSDTCSKSSNHPSNEKSPLCNGLSPKNTVTHVQSSHDVLEQGKNSESSSCDGPGSSVTSSLQQNSDKSMETVVPPEMDKSVPELIKQASNDIPMDTSQGVEKVISEDADKGDNCVIQKKETEKLASEIKDEKQENSEDEDMDDWDKMFDDDGECLDPKAMEELTSVLGKVKIKKPTINYLNYQPREPEMNYDEMSHVIEIYDFPAEFKTEDLISAFSTFNAKGFDIKWVDDTHALGVFNSAIAANDAMKLQHPLLKVGPLSNASRQCKVKAKRAVEFLQPYKPRPETSATTARRLVTGALGLAPRVSREQQKAERQKLKEAREKKKLARKQKDDIWEGTYTPGS